LLQCTTYTVWPFNEGLPAQTTRWMNGYGISVGVKSRRFRAIAAQTERGVCSIRACLGDLCTTTGSGYSYAREQNGRVGSARSRNVVTWGVALSHTGKGIHLFYGDQVSEGTLARGIVEPTAFFPICASVVHDSFGGITDLSSSPLTVDCLAAQHCV
jgi:hypothetical protein